MRALENLKNMIHETNEHTLPTCTETMEDSLSHVLQRCKPAVVGVAFRCSARVGFARVWREVERDFLSRTHERQVAEKVVRPCLLCCPGC